MAETTLAKKLGIKPGNKILVANGPDGYSIDALPDGATVTTSGSGPFDVVQVFVKSKADVDQQTAAAVAALKPGGALWMTYPKGSSKVKTDISRDSGWDTLRAMGWDTVTLVAVDSTWSALRFRPLADIKRK